MKTSTMNPGRNPGRMALVALAVSITAGCAQPAGPGATDKARQVGQTAAKDAREAGSAIGQTGREIGHSVKDAAVNAWEATRQGAQAVGAAASGAVTELRR